MSEIKKHNNVEKLDNVLEYICKMDMPPFRTDGEICNDLGYLQNSKQLHEILDKLEKDGNIRSEVNIKGIKQYYSTFDGQLLLENGRYKGFYLKNYSKTAINIIATLAVIILTIIEILNLLIVLKIIT